MGLEGWPCPPSERGNQCTRTCTCTNPSLMPLCPVRSLRTTIAASMYVLGAEETVRLGLGLGLIHAISLRPIPECSVSWVQIAWASNTVCIALQKRQAQPGSESQAGPLLTGRGGGGQKSVVSGGGPLQRSERAPGSSMRVEQAICQPMI